MIYQIAVALDQLLNAILGGWADETLSARSYRRGLTHKGWAVLRKIIDVLFFFDPDHCYTSYVAEKERRHIAVEYRS